MKFPANVTEKPFEMASQMLVGVLLFLFHATVYSVKCKNSEVSTTSFTTQDATIVSQIAYISEFTLKCSNAGGEKISLFAEIEGRLTPVARIGPNKFQVSALCLPLSQGCVTEGTVLVDLCIRFAFITGELE